MLRDKRWSLVLLSVFVAALFIIGCFNDFRLRRYSSEDKDLLIKMNYVGDWQHYEQRDRRNRWAHAIFFPQQNSAAIAPEMIISIKWIDTLQMASTTIYPFTEDYIKYTLRFKNARVLSETVTVLDQHPAKDLVVAYEMPVAIDRLDVSYIPVRESDNHNTTAMRSSRFRHP